MEKAHKHPCHNQEEHHLSRRDFIKVAGVTAAGIALASCQKAPAATKKPRVAIGQVPDYYDPATIDRVMSEMIDQLGGLGDVVKSGDSVAIKINMTGGLKSGVIPGVTPIESFVTHPLVVITLIKRIKDAGAKDIYIVEAAYEYESFIQWNFQDVADAIGAKIVNLTDAAPYDDFVDVPVGDNSYHYKTLTMNKLLSEIDVFMSVSKMKNHYNAGVTHTMKNLYGLVPYRFYRLNQQDTCRSAFHGTAAEIKNRLPEVIVDVNRARPIHFGLVDGIFTTEAGEGPWIAGIKPIKPHLLIAGKQALATDAVATACMGHDPEGDYPSDPWLRGMNYMNIAAKMGLGTNRLADIEVVGAEIDKVKVQFHGSKD